MSLAPWVSHGNHIASFGNKAVTMQPMSIRAQILLLILLLLRLRLFTLLRLLQRLRPLR